jgi:sterol desaturase/sphingolipid hydroxylase (fatty acid hydroxylase superfamily)
MTIGRPAAPDIMALEDMREVIAAALVQYQSWSIVLIAVAFAALELVVPHHPVNRRRELTRDLVGALAGVVFVMVSYSALQWAVRLTSREGLGGAVFESGALPSVVRVLLVVLVVDFCIYWLHRLMHRSAGFWRMHRWHHSIEEMYWFAGFRASLPHILIYGIPQVIVPSLIFDLSALELAAAAAIGNFVQVWTHANIKAHIGPLQWLIVTPDYHRLHHRASERPAVNLGNVLTVWDRLFGTHEAPDGRRSERCGLVEPRPPLWRMLLGV